MKKVYLLMVMVATMGLLDVVSAQSLSEGCGTMIDADGISYPTVRIGSDCWMAENLRTDVAGASYYLDDATYEPFGRLYTWAAAVGVNNTEQTRPDGTTYVQGICPDGWCIPSAAQYSALLSEGMEALRSNNSDVWLSGFGGSNTSGFNLNGSGLYENGRYQRIRVYADFWEYGVASETMASAAEVRYACDDILHIDMNKENRLSVRCVKVPSEPPFSCGTDKMIDADGNEYEILQIGKQCWTKTNLRVVPAGVPNGTPISARSYTEPYYYVRPAIDAAIFGYYYNWAAAQLVCPSGWHLPSDEEWTIMEQTQTTVDLAAATTNPRGDHSGKLCTEGNGPDADCSATKWWNTHTESGSPGDPSDPNRNASGFGAVPAGEWYTTWDCLGDRTNFWSSTEISSDPGRSWSRYIHASYAGVWRQHAAHEEALSVRCVRD